MEHGPHHRFCDWRFAYQHPATRCTCERHCARDADWGFNGQRMMLPNPLTPNVIQHECVDDAGMIYFRDGKRVAWYRSDTRKNGPSW